ncbi:MAG: hypothetical protein ACP5IJ_00580 [Candidatus Nanoarchaeia archaeon]
MEKKKINGLHAAVVDCLLKKAMEKEPPTEPEKPTKQDPKEIEKLVNELKAKAAAGFKVKK